MPGAAASGAQRSFSTAARVGGSEPLETEPHSLEQLVTEQLQTLRARADRHEGFDRLGDEEWNALARAFADAAPAGRLSEASAEVQSLEQGLDRLDAGTSSSSGGIVTADDWKSWTEQTLRNLRQLAAEPTAAAPEARGRPGAESTDSAAASTPTSSSPSSSRPPTWVRESGMPPEEYWETLVDAEGMLDRLGFLPGTHSRVIELGCGYGTFSIPVASRVSETLRTYDTDEGMLQRTADRAASVGLESRIQGEKRDIVAEGYGIPSGTFDGALLINILHCEDPVGMLRDAASVLEPGGRLYAAHWRHDPSTPRGPPMAIRPRPGQIQEWALETGILAVEGGPVDCPPWHYGWVFRRV